MMGEQKLSKKVVSQLTFDFTIESIGECCCILVRGEILQ